MFDASIQTVMDKVDRLRKTTDDHMQIPREQALLIAQILRIGRCRSMCEIGTSYGYSTLHLAAVAAEHDGCLHAVDISENKYNATCAHLTEAGLIDRVTLHLGDAREVLPQIEPDEPFDFVFIDARKDESIAYFQAVRDKLADRAIVIADNTGDLAEQMKPFIEYIRAEPGAMSCDVPMAHGFELTILDRV
jgi:predicted O-methyltransferase YrrM